MFSVLALSACSDEGTEPLPEGGETTDAGSAPDGELVAWMGVFCGTYETFTADLIRLPEVERPIPEPPTEADRQPLVDVLTARHELLESAHQEALDLPTPPLEAAELADECGASLAEQRDLTGEYLDHAGRFPAEELDAVYGLSALEEATWIPFDEFLPEYLEQRHPGLTQPYRDAANCAE